MSNDILLEVENLTVHFDTYEGRQRVLDGVDLTIHEGETVALVGETGCGKSVTAKTIIGMLAQPPGDIVEGSIRYRGNDLLADPAEHERAKVEEMSMVFQDPMTHLSPVFTIGTTMSDVYTYQGRDDMSWWDLLKHWLSRDGTHENEIRNRCIEMLKKMQIPNPESILDRYPVELSGGMCQRVLLAMGLLNDPTFLIADEPTTALDVTVQEQIIDLLRERIQEQNLSMLYITHNLGVARELADRIYVMYAGDIAETGATETLFDQPLHPYTKGLVDSIPKLTSLDSTGIPGNIPDYADPPSGCRFHPRCPAYMEGTCERNDPVLYTMANGEEEDHSTACFLYEDGMDSKKATRVAEIEIDYDYASEIKTGSEMETEAQPEPLKSEQGEGSDDEDDSQLPVERRDGDGE